LKKDEDLTFESTAKNY